MRAKILSISLELLEGVITVPKLMRFGEIKDDHVEQLCKELLEHFYTCAVFELNGFRMTVVDGIPQDAEIKKLGFCFEKYSLLLLLESLSFPDIEPCVEIPLMDVSVVHTKIY